jgi:hypothetical protein
VLEAAADRLAVDRHQPSGRQFHHGRHPVQEATLEAVGIEQGEDAVERVVRGDAAGQVQERGEPLGLAPAPERDLRPAVGPADHRQHGDHDQVVQLMRDEVPGAGVGHVTEKAQETSGRSGVHAKAPLSQKG